MPSIELRVDNRYFRIDSADLEMCGKWFMDCITMYPINPATLLQLRVMPFFVPIPEDQRSAANHWHGEAPDWTCDSRHLWNYTVRPEHTAADAARGFAKMLEGLAQELEAPADAKPTEEGTHR